MLIVDSHLDLAWNALQWNRDIRQNVYTIRTQEASTPGKGRAQNTVALPDMRRGEVALCLATLLARSTGRPLPHIDFASPAQAHATARGQFAYYEALVAEGQIHMLTDWTGIQAHISAWRDAPDADAMADPTVGCLISMESADPIISPAELDDWFQLGVRFIGPAHYGNGRYAGGTSVEDGLTDLGIELLREMDQLGIVLDLTHLSDAAFWQALEHYNGVVLASHNNCRALVPHQRQFSDDQIRAIVERDGVIGVAFDAWMLEPGWTIGESTNEQVTLATVVDHIDHICKLAGDTDHVGIGSDLDGGFGREQSPHDLDTIADLQNLAPLLRERDYTEADVEKILHGNWLRLLQRALS